MTRDIDLSPAVELFKLLAQIDARLEAEKKKPAPERRPS